MQVLRSLQARETATPNATMRTFASPELTGTAFAMWKVTMTPGQRGPVHTFDTEQVWTVLGGLMEALTEHGSEQLAVGDTAVFPGGEQRQIVCAGAAPLEAIVTCSASARASTPGDGDRGTPPWIL